MKHKIWEFIKKAYSFLYGLGYKIGEKAVMLVRHGIPQPKDAFACKLAAWCVVFGSVLFVYHAFFFVCGLILKFAAFVWGLLMALPILSGFLGMVSSATMKIAESVFGFAVLAFVWIVVFGVPFWFIRSQSGLHSARPGHYMETHVNSRAENDAIYGVPFESIK